MSLRVWSLAPGDFLSGDEIRRRLLPELRFDSTFAKSVSCAVFLKVG